MSTDSRIVSLEQRVALLESELTAVRQDLRSLRLERDFTWPVAAFTPSPAAPAPPPVPAAPPLPARAAPPLRARAAPAPAASARGGRSLGWEDLLAGRVMAWVGGSAVLVGLILFLALAVSRGWIGEEARTALAGMASLLLIAAGARAYERRGRTEAALSATAAGVAGGFATLAVATEVYALLPAVAGLAGGFGLGAVGAVLALRWRSRTIAVLGIAGALVSPVLVGADLGEAVTIGLLAAAYAGAVTVCVALGWAWLGLLAFAFVTPQWAFHLVENDQVPVTLAVVIAFWLLGALAAVGFELRVRTDGFRLASPPPVGAERAHRRARRLRGAVGAAAGLPRRRTLAGRAGGGPSGGWPRRLPQRARVAVDGPRRPRHRHRARRHCLRHARRRAGAPPDVGGRRRGLRPAPASQPSPP